MPFIYPPSPTADKRPPISYSPEFKQAATRTAWAVVVFALTFLLLFVISILICVGCVKLAIWVVGASSAHLKIYSILLGVGLVALGGMLIYYMIKFLFRSKMPYLPGAQEVTQHEQPELFAFINQLTRDIHAPLPRKVYLTTDYNTSVFSRSTFWELLFPGKSDLAIGWGLLHLLTVSEFKALLAHEFAHLSDKSPVGRWAFHADRVLQDLLSDDERYEDTTFRVATIPGGALAGFSEIFIAIFKIILSYNFVFVNRNAMKLSRESELRADLVAGSVTGSQALIRVLWKVEFIYQALEEIESRYQRWYGDKKDPSDIFRQLRFIVLKQVKAEGFAIEHGLPVITRGVNKSDLYIYDDADTHPSTATRERNLRNINVIVEESTLPALDLFRGAADLEQQLSRPREEVQNERVLVDSDSFEAACQREDEVFNIDPFYHGIYDTREIHVFDLEKSGSPLPEEFDIQLTLAEHARLLEQLQTASFEKEVLSFLPKDQDGKSFELAGLTYSGKDTGKLLKAREIHVSEITGRLDTFDFSLFQYFQRQWAKLGKEAELEMLYRSYFKRIEECTENYKLLIDMGTLFSEAESEKMDTVLARKIVKAVKRDEPSVKDKLRTWFEDPTFRPLIYEPEMKILEEYLSSDLIFFKNNNFVFWEIELFRSAMFSGAILAERMKHLLKKQLLKNLLEV